MGNSLQGASLLSNDVHFPSHIQLGRYATIDIDNETSLNSNSTYPRLILPGYFNYNPTKKWIMSYKVDGSTCCLAFDRHFTTDGKINQVELKIHDDICSGDGIHVKITKGENNVLELDSSDPQSCFLACGHFFSRSKTQFNSTINTLGVVTETTIVSYGGGSKGGHVILEKKKKSKDENPYMMTMAHYYAISCGNFFGGSKIDIGLSTIVKVQASNDMGLDIKVEGPVQHSATALVYMFDEVKKTGTWKPTSCPHCAKIKKQQQRNLMPWQQSETEDSDGFPPPRRNVPNQTGQNVIANDGAIRGNHNGNVIVSSRQSFFRGSYR